MDFNNTIPEWKNTGTEPSDSLKNSGFSAGYKPPANVFNWFWNRVTKAITEIQTNLSNVDNTSDANKPVSTATQTALNGKADKSTVVENNESSSSATLNQVGWYKVAEFNNKSEAVDGNFTNSCEFAIKRVYNNASNEYHKIVFSSVTGIHTFTSLSNASRTQLITKCRYVGGKNRGDKDYLYIYYNSSSGNPVEIAINNAASFGMYWKAITPEYVGTDDITGSIIYNIPANSDVAQKEVTLWGGDDSKMSLNNNDFTLKLLEEFTNYNKLCFYYMINTDKVKPVDIIEYLGNGCLDGLIVDGQIAVYEDATTFQKLEIVCGGPSIPSNSYLYKITGIK